MYKSGLRFAIIGVGGYIAPRHLKAIKDTGNILVAALDKNDSVGIMDSYFPDADFFTEFERFDRHIDKLRRRGEGVDFVSICSPNYLHDAHIRFALRSGANAICEKPLVLNPWNVEGLREMEKETGKKVYTILQLRLHENIIKTKRMVEETLKRDPLKIWDIDLTYITSRGNWYFTSWKGDDSKSGGLATNIGIHFFDMLSFIFGDFKKNVVYLREKDAYAGYLELEHARVRWFLSVNAKYLPESAVKQGKRTYRSITMDGVEIEFSEGFTELHTESYRHILSGGGFGLDDALPSIKVVSEIRHIDIEKDDTGWVGKIIKK
ncbi:Gfo/Idh/MocA family protein [Calditerrivibrio nitroreducens]|uniref:Oxidoreductase domain protein n=1 Tax=Calditerrivibrio nitroreducens (strain DSM 19672 / NBRC 101217 / Yu37-1) TaxID=768670 RepID=E4TGC4_CALNY|nr:Gfo/Idh/MocA family oxidoreductase [Calditerrivibrio nitroreducens]ADR19711.1 oxidoreductase domain protein [Calditerrivibrio nitroreducens DSM 19672]